MAEFVKLDIRDHIATVTLDRPPVNAITAQVSREIAEAFDGLRDDREVRVAIFTGAGRCFCAGADIRAAAERAAGDQEEHHRIARNAHFSIYDCAVPVIGAINGPALGGGLALAAVCDILIAAEEAVLGLPEINVGLLGGGRYLARLVPEQKVRRMMFTGQRLPAREMAQYGTIERVVPGVQLMDAARELAQEIASKSPVAIRLAKESLNRSEYVGLKDGYRTEQDYTSKLANYEDSLEAKRAFLEKRAPVFKGR
ncbi:MAG: enoyl-CoA hydratase/isomerase family protein [Chloroflexi bacterium]|nr:enoyl-CoA hydratase/isomerase family protein [Chloroflexota bacterium]